MPVTEVRAPDGRIVKVKHPEGATQEQIIAFAKQNASQPEPSFSTTERLVGFGEKGLNLLTGTVATPISGLGGLITGALPGGMSAAEGVQTVGSALTFDPHTKAGQAPTIVGDAFRWIMDKVDRGLEVTGESTAKLADPNQPLTPERATALQFGLDVAARNADPQASPVVSTGLKTFVLGLPAIFGLKNINFLKPKAGGPVKASSSLDLGTEGIMEAAEKVVTSTFQKFRTTVGDETSISISNTLAAARQALNELHKQGKGKSAFAKELQGIVATNRTGVIPAAMLDDISSNMMKAMTNSKSVGTRQAKAVLEAVVKDMDEAGKAVGLNFADDLATSRAFAALYRSRNDLGRVIGQHGEKLKAFGESDPVGYREIITDWAGRKLESFVSVNAAGGRQFNTAKFAQFVADNESHLAKLLGPETVKVWKAFPKWEGRASLLKGLGQRVLEAKTGGLSRMFNRQIDLQFAEGIAAALTDPTSPLYRALSAQKQPSALPLPTRVFEAGVAQEERR